MSKELADLYREVVVDHSKSPRNFRALPHATKTVEGFNPLCGDRLTLYVTIDGEVLSDVAFEGTGCAISKASASLMTESVKGRSRDEVQGLFDKMHEMLTHGLHGNETKSLGKLVALSGIHEFPARIKCATLSWHALKSALECEGSCVSTE